MGMEVGQTLRGGGKKDVRRSEERREQGRRGEEGLTLRISLEM